ncbi:uncharacterized protein LOC131164705 [Malania oleifera]|uniref:uncharacterized protein LOC131164705 n=1 Tax=Malania oleifera TaxID=397392 RepID=UPI0025ADEB9A|nr:uncharacterized protein LOC131164705 [Malania oleifera]
MERSEPVLVPEWLKSGGNVSGVGGSASHQIASSSSQSDDQAVSKPARSKSSSISSGHDIGHSISDRTPSSYLRWSSSSNGSSSTQSYSSFGRSYHNRDRKKDIRDYRVKDKSILGDLRHCDYSDKVGNIWPIRSEKDVLSCTQSISGKQGEMWPRKVTADLSNVVKAPHSNGNCLINGDSIVSTMHKAAFERDFPSLVAEDRKGASEMGRVPSPSLSTAIKSLPMGSLAAIGGDGWTSALAEVPLIIGNNSTFISQVQNTVSANSSSSTSSMTPGLNMAETLAQRPCSRTIPEVLNPLEKPKPKVGQQQLQMYSHLVSHSARSTPSKSDALKTSNVGKLHILKPARERNGVMSTAKDSLGPTNGSKGVSGPFSVAPLVAVSPALSAPNLANSECKLAITPAVEKRLTSQVQSRNDFFNLMRKKNSVNSPSATLNHGNVVSSAVLEKSDDFTVEAATSPVTRFGDGSSLATTGEVSTESRDVMTNNGDATGGYQKFLNNSRLHPSSDATCYPEEEEAAFLRSLGWEENAGEDEGLTEEEINSFFKQHMMLRSSSKLLKGMQLRISVQLKAQGGGSGNSSGSSLSIPSSES